MESLVLSPQDVENLEAMSDGSTGYFYKMLDYLEKRVEDGVRRGRFSEEAAKADLETALWYSYACNNLDEYESYCRAAQWMAASEGSAEAARCGMWYYRYSCALLYCGRLEEALAYAEKGVAVEPDYVWGWLQLGKLRSHFGDTAGALAAVERGLALEPGDYEFTTLAREIREGRSLEEMEYHWIDPEQDRRLQAGEAEEGEMADKRLAIACILCDRANLEAVKAALGVTEWEADAPYCTFTMPYGEGTVQGRFFGNEAALSKLSAEWAAALAARLPELDRRGRTFLELRAELQTDGLELAWFTIQRDQGLRLCFQGGGHSQMVLFGADFSLREEGQPALEQPGSAGNFLAFVLLEEPECVEHNAGAPDGTAGESAETVTDYSQYRELLPMFRQMAELTDKLRKKRQKRGSIDFDFPECKILLDKEGHPLDIKPYERNVATMLIEDFMLAANETVAQHFYWQELPFVYRVHDVPDPERIQKLSTFISNYGYYMKALGRRNSKVSTEEIHPKEIQKLLQKIEGTPEEPMIARLTLRSMKQAKYSTECTGHFGLACQYYCHFTSPIRRYPDLQIHRIIKEQLRGRLKAEREEHYRDILPEVAKHSSEMERRADEAERETDKLKKVEYMEQHIGEEYEGVISGVTGWGLYVELPNTVEGLIHISTIPGDYYHYNEAACEMVGEATGRCFKLGMPVRIEVEDCDRFMRTINFRLVDQ